MDKKSIANDLYQAVVISVFVVGYWMLGKKILKITPPKHPEIRSGRHEKAGCYCHCIRDYERVSHQTEDPTRAHQHLKIACIAMLIEGALANALAFNRSSYLFLRQSKDSINVRERDTMQRWRNSKKLK